MHTEPNTDHPARYSAEVLPFLDAELSRLAARGPTLFGPPVVVDPFGGDGLAFHAAGDRHSIETTAIELEPEWAANHERNIVGDARRLGDWFEPGTIDLVFTSPCYGNRMADDHDNRDPCSECVPPVGHHPSIGADGEPCKKCKGTGLSRRNTYRHRLGHPLSAGTGANLRFVAGRRGDKYRRVHSDVWEAVRVGLAPHAAFVVNVSNHLETVDDRIVEHRCVEWHLDHLTTHGFRLDAVHPIGTRRNRHGANGGTRADHEFVLRLVKR